MTRQWTRRHWLVVVALAAASSIGILLWVTDRRSDDDGRSILQTTETSTASAVSTGSLLPASDLQDIGPLVTTSQGAIQSSNRADLVVAQLPMGSVINLRLIGSGCNAPCQPTFHGVVEINARLIDLVVQATHPDDVRFRAVNAHVVQIESSNASATVGEVMLFARDRDGRAHRVTLDTRGHLFVDPQPIPADAVIVYTTGDKLDGSAMRRMGELPSRSPEDGSFYFTVGSADGCCWVSFRTARGAALTAPVSGSLTCFGPGEMELVTGEHRLRFENVRLKQPAEREGLVPCATEGTVGAGEQIGPPGHYMITALTASAEPIAVAVSGDGALYVGNAAITSSCPPCRGS